jgi:2-phosphosulfolactate phosphatase
VSQELRDPEVYGVRFDWGPVGAARASRHGGVIVIVDVLSFTTAVSVAVDRDVVVYPAAAGDQRARELARAVDGVLAVGRRDVTEEHPWSLSPAALRSGTAPRRLVLPSPNGSAIAAAAEGLVVAACLRNARAVAVWLGEHAHAGNEAITVIAAGERWPDGSMRPALEDFLGAGAVIAALADVSGSKESPEAACARAAYRATQAVPDAVRNCVSGVELRSDGFGEDVEVAVELDASDGVPVRVDGAFR